jgi:fucose permease
LAYAAFVLVGLSAGVGGVLLPAQIRDYGVDKSTVGITFFTFAAGFMLSGVSAGALVQRFGIRMALILGGGGYVMAGLYMATRPSFGALVTVQLLAGYGIGVLESVLNVYLTTLSSATTLLNRLHAFFGVGALLGPLLAAWMLGSFAWTGVWLVLALLCLPVLVGFAMTYPARAAPAAGHEATGHGAQRAELTPSASPPRGAAEPERDGVLGAVLRQPAVLLAAAFLAVYVGLEVSVGNWGFSFLVEAHGQGRLLAGYAVSGFWLGLTLGRFLISPLATRIGLSAVDMMFGCLVGVTVAAALTWLAPVAAAASIGLVFLGFFLGPLFPTAMAVVPSLTTTRFVPTAIGVMNGVSVIGGAAFPWLAGTIAQAIGAWTLLPFVATLALLQFAIWRSLTGRMLAA